MARDKGGAHRLCPGAVLELTERLESPSQASIASRYCQSRIDGNDISHERRYLLSAIDTPMRTQQPRLHVLLKRLIRLVVVATFLLTIAGGLGFLGLAWRIDQTASGDPIHPTDAIVVLGAWVRADGSPGPDLRARTWAAVELYNTLRATGQNPVLITTGGFENERLSAASVARRKAIEWGVPAQAIWLADGGQTTEEDALFTARLMRVNGWQSATLVSHPLHLYRSRWYFERAGVSPLYTYPAGNVERLPVGARLFLDFREAAAVVWGAVNGWERFGPVGYWLEAVFYHRVRS